MPILQYSIKNDRRIGEICAPLIDSFDISLFTYGFVGADGTFGYLTNALEYNEYYFSQKIYLENPYFSHPALFRSGLCFNERGFEIGSFLLDINSNGSLMEYFIYANKSSKILHNLSLLNKFRNYFKNEARDLIGNMKADRFNIRLARGDELFEKGGDVPLRSNDPNALTFLKQTSGLSNQQLNDLKYFRKIPFTNREKEVIEQLLNGYYSSEIAKNLFLSDRTVEHHIEKIKDKLDCKTKSDLIRKIRALESIGYLFLR